MCHSIWLYILRLKYLFCEDMKRNKYLISIQLISTYAAPANVYRNSDFENLKRVKRKYSRWNHFNGFICIGFAILLMHKNVNVEERICFSWYESFGFFLSASRFVRVRACINGKEYMIIKEPNHWWYASYQIDIMEKECWIWTGRENRRGREKEQRNQWWRQVLGQEEEGEWVKCFSVSELEQSV